MYYYLIEYQGKQKHLLPFRDTNLKQFCWQYNLKMSNKVKGINIKNRTYCFFNDIINIENVNRNNIKIYEN